MMTILQETVALDLQLLLRDTLRRSRPCAWERSWTSAATTHARSATVELPRALPVIMYRGVDLPTESRQSICESLHFFRKFLLR